MRIRAKKRTNILLLLVLMLALVLAAPLTVQSAAAAEGENTGEITEGPGTGGELTDEELEAKQAAEEAAAKQAAEEAAAKQAAEEAAAKLAAEEAAAKQAAEEAAVQQLAPRLPAALPAPVAAAANHEVSTAQELAAALDAVADGDTITLKGSIDYDYDIMLDGISITLNVGAYILNLTGENLYGGPVLTVKNGAVLELESAGGSFNITGGQEGVRSGDYEEDGGAVTVTSISLPNGYRAVDAFGGSVTVLKDVNVPDMSEATAIMAFDGALVDVKGAVYCGRQAVYAEGKNTQVICGPVTVTTGCGVEAYDLARIEVKGDITSATSAGVRASWGGYVLVHGNVTGGYSGAEAWGSLHKESKLTEVIIKGDVKTTQSSSVGASAGGAEITIDGEIYLADNDSRYVTIGDGLILTKNDTTEPPTKEGYRTYTDGYEYEDGYLSYGTVWVKGDSAPEPAIEINGFKYISGIDETDQEFKFLLTQVYWDQEDKLAVVNEGIIVEASRKGAGEFFFDISSLAYGSYYFLAEELAGNAPGWSYDSTTYVIGVDMDEGEDGRYANIYYPEGCEGCVTFSNSFEGIIGEKLIEGLKSTNQTFTFKLTEVYEEPWSNETETENRFLPVEDGIVKTVSRQGAGMFFFDLTDLEPRESGYYFWLEELNDHAAGWSYDDTRYLVSVYVYGYEGWRGFSVGYPSEDQRSLSFTNTYTAPISPVISATSVTIQGHKSVTGIENTNQTFRFKLTEAKDTGEPIAGGMERIISRQGAGDFSFELNLEKGGYCFLIEELNDGVSGWSYDTKQYLVNVLVGGEQTAATIYYPEGGVSFSNSYSAPRTSSGGGSERNQTILLAAAPLAETIEPMQTPTASYIPEPPEEVIEIMPVPLGNLPQTGPIGLPLIRLLAILGLVLMGAGTITSTKQKQKQE